MPVPGEMVGRSAAYTPAMVTGVTVHPDRPFEFDFLLDTGEFSGPPQELRAESLRLIKYFLAALTVPDRDLWVNLSPRQAERTIPGEFALTDMGRDLLMQDYLLKQFTASLMYPDDETGQAFWQRVRQRAQQQFGTTDVPVNTFNKVWIVPQDAVVYQEGNAAYVVKSSLKVMMEEDYLAAAGESPRPPASEDDFAAAIVREVLIPEIEHEVNHGMQFARLRQIYHALILATWYKENRRDAFINQLYSNRNKITGIDIRDTDSKDKIYTAYMQAFRRGVYNIIREDYDPYRDRLVPRNYFSGGMNIKPKVTVIRSRPDLRPRGDMAMISAKLDLVNNGRRVAVASPAADQALTVEQMDPDERRKYVISLLNRRVVRPEPEELIGLEPREIALIAHGRKLTVNPIQEFRRLHEIALPVLESKLRAVGARHSAEKPVYVVLSRDGDMIYDMLRLIDPAAAKAGRVKLINISLRQSERFLNPDSPFYDPQQAEGMRRYLEQEGLSAKELLSDQRFVFIDTAYKGTIFDTLLKVNGVTRKDMNGRLFGYLVFRDDDRSTFWELPEARRYDAQAVRDELAAVFGDHLFDLMPEFVRERWDLLDADRQANFLLALYLQIQPKFLRNANAVLKIDGRWHSLNGAYATYYQDLKPISEVAFHNPHQMDPVAALQLQALTAAYFRQRQPDDAAILVHEGGRISFNGPYLIPAFTFYAMRHGETPANARNIFQGSTDDPILNHLSPKGLDDAERGAQNLYALVAPLLKRGRKVVVLTSGLTRTKQSAQPFLDLIQAKIAAGELPADIRLEVRADPDLNEINFGSLSNVDPADYTAEQAAFEQAYRRGKNAALIAPGGESYLDLIERGRAWLEGMNRRYAGTDTAVVVFGHGTFLSTLQILTGIKDMTDSTGLIDWISNRPKNGEVVTFRADEAVLVEPAATGINKVTLDRQDGAYAEVGRYFVHYRSAQPEGLSSVQPATDAVIADARARGKEIISLADYSLFHNRPVYESADTAEEPAQVWDHTQTAMAALQSVDVSGKTVVDLGAGDGILSVLAMREGARRVIAVDGMNTAGLIEMNMSENEPTAGAYGNRLTFRMANLDRYRIPGIPRMNWHLLEEAQVVVMNLPTGMRDHILEQLADPKTRLDLSGVETLIVAGSFEDEAAGEWRTDRHRALLRRLGFKITRKVRVPRDDTYVTAFVLQRDRPAVSRPTLSTTFPNRHRPVEFYLNDVLADEFERTGEAFTRFVEVGLGGSSIIGGKWAPTFFDWFERLNKLRRRSPAVPWIELTGIEREPGIVEGINNYYRQRRPVRVRGSDKLQVLQGDFSKLQEMPEGSADVVRVMNVISHYPSVTEQQAFYRAVTHALREGGLFLRSDNGLATLWRKEGGRLVPLTLLLEPNYKTQPVTDWDTRQFPAEELYGADASVTRILNEVRAALNRAAESFEPAFARFSWASLIGDTAAARYAGYIKEFDRMLPEELSRQLKISAKGVVSIPLTAADQAMAASEEENRQVQLINQSRINVSSRISSFEHRLDEIDLYLKDYVTSDPQSLVGHIVVVGFGDKTEQLTAVAERYPHAQIIGIEYDGPNADYVREQITKTQPAAVAQRIRVYQADARDLKQVLADESAMMVIYPKALDFFELANTMNGGGQAARALIHTLLTESHRFLAPGGVFVATGRPLMQTKAFLVSQGYDEVFLDTFDEEAIFGIKGYDNAVLVEEGTEPSASVAERVRLLTVKWEAGFDNVEADVQGIYGWLTQHDFTAEQVSGLIDFLLSPDGPLISPHIPTVMETLDTLNWLGVHPATAYLQKIQIYEVMHRAVENPALEMVGILKQRITAIRENVRVYFRDHFDAIVGAAGQPGEVDYEVLEFLAEEYFRVVRDYVQMQWMQQGAGRRGGVMYLERARRARIITAFGQLLGTGELSWEERDDLVRFLTAYRGPLSDPLRGNALAALELLERMALSDDTDWDQKRDIYMVLSQDTALARTAHIFRQIDAAADRIEAYLDRLDAAEEDAALTATENPGGIDFTGPRLRVDVIRDPLGQPVPLEQQPVLQIPIDGVVPVIIQIQPVPRLPLLMGARPESEPPVSTPANDALSRDNRQDIFEEAKPAVL